MTRRVILVLTLLFALPLVAQTKHLVSRIDVRGDVPAAIITSQSALVEGRSYSDKDLDVAVARLRRLPFVYDARYTIDGDTLVIDVDGVTRFFGDLDATASGFENDQTGTALLGGGGRLFVGSGGVVTGRVTEFVAEHSDNATVDAEYAHYGIGGSRFFASAGVSYSPLHDDGFEPDPALRLLVGYPLNVRQTLTASASDEGFRGRNSFSGVPGRFDNFSDRQTLSLRWTYDTSEDPFFARTGLTLNAGPSWAKEESQFQGIAVTFPDLGFEIVTFRNDGTTTTLAADVKKFWSIGARGAVFSGAGVSFDHSEADRSIGDQIVDRNDLDGNTASIFAGYAYNLFDRVTGGSATRQRIELGAGYTRREADQSFTPFGGTFTSDVTTVNATYVLRRQFATVRLGLIYAFD